jgi:hypothetical protein
MYEQANDDLHTSSKQSGRRDFLKVAQSSPDLVRLALASVCVLT